MFSEEIIEVLDYVGQKMGIAIDWSSENVMPYLETLAQKYINWEIATSCIWMVLGIVLLAAGWFVFKLTKKKCENEDWDFWFDVQPVLCAIFIVVAVFTALPIITTQAFDIAKCICIPELQIYQFISDLMDK